MVAFYFMGIITRKELRNKNEDTYVRLNKLLKCSKPIKHEE